MWSLVADSIQCKRCDETIQAADLAGERILLLQPESGMDEDIIVLL